MNWAYIIAGAGVLIGLLTLVYNLATRRSDGAIKSLEAHNKFLQEQVDRAKSTAPDVLVKTLSERRAIMDEELQRLLKDRDYNRIEIRVLQEKINKSRKIQNEVQLVFEEYQRRYEDLKRKVDVCPFCEAELKTRGDLEPGNPGLGTEKTYYCGYSVIVDGSNGRDPDEVTRFCSSDPEYPKLDERKIMTQPNILMNGEWFAFVKMDKVDQMEVVGKSKEEAIENLKKKYYAKYPFR